MIEPTADGEHILCPYCGHSDGGRIPLDGEEGDTKTCATCGYEFCLTWCRRELPDHVRDRLYRGERAKINEANRKRRLRDERRALARIAKREAEVREWALTQPLVVGACPHCGGDMTHMGTVCAGEYASTNIAYCLACGHTAERTYIYDPDGYVGFNEDDWVKSDWAPAQYSDCCAGRGLLRGVA